MAYPTPPNRTSLEDQIGLFLERINRSALKQHSISVLVIIKLIIIEFSVNQRTALPFPFKHLLVSSHKRYTQVEPAKETNIKENQQMTKVCYIKNRKPNQIQRTLIKDQK